MKVFFVTLLVFVCSVLYAQGLKSKENKLVYIVPPSAFDGKSFRDLFDYPDLWKNTRSKIDAIGYADHMLNRQFNDKELTRFFSLVDKWNKKFFLEVGAVKPWGMTGQEAFDAQKPMWDRFIKCGANISFINLDEPLVCAKEHINKTFDYAVIETANFIELVRKEYPDIQIGDVESYPGLSIEENLAWIDALQAELSKRNVKALDFYTIDMDWTHFILNTGGSMSGLKQIELGCKERGIPFQLIYWAANYPALKNIGFDEDFIWYNGVMRQGYDYALAGGDPDVYIIESWLDSPKKTVPDNKDFTFTKSVLDFCNRFLKK